MLVDELLFPVQLSLYFEDRTVWSECLELLLEMSIRVEAIEPTDAGSRLARLNSERAFGGFGVVIRRCKEWKNLCPKRFGQRNELEFR